MAISLEIQFGQRVQRRIESQQVHGATSGQGHALEQSLLLATAPFDRAVFARILHQNLPHQKRANGNNVLAISELVSSLLGKPHIGLVDQCRALQSVTRPFLLQVVVRNAAQFAVDDRKNSAETFLAPGLPIGQEGGNGFR